MAKNWLDDKGVHMEVGGEYTAENGKLFSFAKDPNVIFDYYRFDLSNRVVEIEAFERVQTDEVLYFAKRIKVVRELTWEELLARAREYSGIPAEPVACLQE